VVIELEMCVIAKIIDQSKFFVFAVSSANRQDRTVVHSSPLVVGVDLLLVRAVEITEVHWDCSSLIVIVQLTCASK
jgi:hypothetical protein